MTEFRIPNRFPRPPVWFWVAVIAGAIATSILVWMLLGISDRTSDRANKAEDRVAKLEERLDRAEAGVAANAQQLESLGAEPLVQPEDIDGNVVVVPGPPGPRGQDGRDGLPGATGPGGTPGETGAAGATGATGATGDTGPAGADGEPGAAGPEGPAGAQGSSGQTTCPDGFTFQDVTIPSSPGIVFRICAAPAPTSP